MSDHYTVIGETFAVKFEQITSTESKSPTRILKTMKADIVLKALFFSGQKLMELDEDNFKHSEQKTRTILECSERFAPTTEIKKRKLQ